jgi:hypothetical protein
VSWRLFLDDERYPVTTGWMIARSSAEAIELCKEYGFPSFITFDHDLGGEDTALVFINWMIDRTLDSVSTDRPPLQFPKSYSVHSQNPVGAANIKSLMDSFINHIYESPSHG